MVWLIFLGLLPKNTFGEPSMAFLMSRLVKLFWKQCVNPVIGFEAHLFLACIVHEGIGRVISRHTRAKEKQTWLPLFVKFAPRSLQTLMTALIEKCLFEERKFLEVQECCFHSLIFSGLPSLFSFIPWFCFFFFPLFSPLWGSPLTQGKRLRRAGFLQPASAP